MLDGLHKYGTLFGIMHCILLVTYVNVPILCTSSTPHVSVPLHGTLVRNTYISYACFANVRGLRISAQCANARPNHQRFTHIQVISLYAH